MTAVTVGTFDGVHTGHRALVSTCRELVGALGKVIALAFDPHPLTRLKPGLAPARLTTFERKALLLREAGADHVERLTPDDALLHESPEEFLAFLRARFAPNFIVEGNDFRFGRDRAGDVAFLQTRGPEFGMSCQVVESVEAVLDDHSIAAVSSSKVRWMLAHARVRDAGAMLGRGHLLDGVVVRGDRLGRTIGIPTCNIRTECMLPALGVYAALAHMPKDFAGPRRLAAALNIGTRPTVSGLDVRVEAHLLTPSTSIAWAPLPGLSEYDWPICLELVGWVRDQAKFASLDALKAQIARDCARVRDICSERSAA